MNKPNTARLLDDTQSFNEELKQANIVAGAQYGPGSRFYQEDKQRPEFEDMPTLEHEYKGYTLKPGTEANWNKWEILPQSGLELPKPLSGLWNGVPDCEKAIDDFLSGRKTINPFHAWDKTNKESK
jgi:hypothetical protein